MRRGRYARAKYDISSSGVEHEIDVFGKFPIHDDAYLKELNKLKSPDDDREIPYVPFKAAVELARKHQPGDPESPKSEFMRELRLAVYDRMDTDPSVEPAAVQVFSAINTPLDRYHGTDGFLIMHKADKDYLVNMDATLNRQKTEHKADVFIREIPSYLKEKEFMESVDRYSEMIWNVLTDKMSRDEYYKRS